jgi:hypothetical protein
LTKSEFVGSGWSHEEKSGLVLKIPQFVPPKNAEAPKWRAVTPRRDGGESEPASQANTAAKFSPHPDQHDEDTGSKEKSKRRPFTPEKPLQLRPPSVDLKKPPELPAYALESSEGSKATIRAPTE